MIAMFGPREAEARGLCLPLSEYTSDWFYAALFLSGAAPLAAVGLYDPDPGSPAAGHRLRAFLRDYGAMRRDGRRPPLPPPPFAAGPGSGSGPAAGLSVPAPRAGAGHSGSDFESEAEDLSGGVDEEEEDTASGAEGPTGGRSQSQPGAAPSSRARSRSRSGSLDAYPLAPVDRGRLPPTSTSKLSSFADRREAPTWTSQYSIRFQWGQIRFRINLSIDNDLVTVSRVRDAAVIAALGPEQAVEFGLVDPQGLDLYRRRCPFYRELFESPDPPFVGARDPEGGTAPAADRLRKFLRRSGVVQARPIIFF
eukprot:tig00000219_g19474.t1